MRKKRRNGRVTTETSVEDEIAHLRGLDLKGLRARWQSVLQRPAPDHLPRHLLFAIIAYRIQAERFGDLDHETRQLLDRTGAKESGTAMSAGLVSFDQKRTEPTPGTVLVREWDRQSQRVMVMADGFAWNGHTYDSLSKVAFAITGTKWMHGPIHPTSSGHGTMVDFTVFIAIASATARPMPSSENGYSVCISSQGYLSRVR